MIRFEKAAKEDADELVRVALSAFAKEAIKYGHFPPGLSSVDRHVAAMTSGLYYKILDDDTIVGGVMVDDLGGGHFYLNTIFVGEAAQHQGIGSQAIRFVESAVPEAKKWSLKTPAASEGNHRFYESLGYVKVREAGPEEYPHDSNRLSFFIFEKSMSG